MSDIRFENVTRRFANGVEAVSDASFTLSAGSMTFLWGRSGAGKSTLLKLLLAELRPTEGRIWVGDADVTRLSQSAIARYRRHVGTVFHDHRLLTHRTLFENVAVPLWVAGVGRAETERRVLDQLAQVGLSEKAMYWPEWLSEGEQQRAIIARAFINDPRLLLADEPTGPLDPELSRLVMTLFQRCKRQGTTVVVASHDRTLTNEMAERVVYIENGKIIRS